MNFKKYFLSLVMITVISVSGVMALGNEGTLNAKSTTGKVQITVRAWEADAGVSEAQLVIPEGTVDLSKYESYSVIDLPNHLLTICFSLRAQAGDPASAKIIKVWALPTSFVKLAGTENSWRFKLKIAGTMIKDVTTMEGTFEWKP